LAICKNSGMIAIDNSIDKWIHLDSIVEFSLWALIIKNAIKLEYFLSFFSQLYTISQKSVPNLVFIIIEMNSAPDLVFGMLMFEEWTHADVDWDWRHEGW
jgi:hypothetical protein